MMKRTRAKRQRMRRRMIRRMAWRMVIGVMGITILVAAGKLTSLALKQLTVAGPQQKGQDTDTGEDLLTKEFEQKESSEAFGTKDILLVNKDHPLPESYQPDLKRLSAYGAEVDERIYDPLCRMLEDGEKEGLSFWIASSYRSTERQRELLDEDIDVLVHQGYSYSEAYEEVVRETMPVGCSEHATGLAVDIVSKNYQILDERQGTTKEILWLQEHCSQYGFILRYPREKEDITKVSYESWHFRYVGTDAAEKITSQGITLEEYLDSVE